jgi:PDZ domain
MSRAFPAITFVLLGAIVGAANPPTQAPAPRAIDVAALVRQLGSGDFAERETAARRLSALPVDEVPPELLAALRSEDPEIRARAARVVPALSEHIVLSRLPRGARFARKGQVDLYVASTAATPAAWKADDDRIWNPALSFGHALIKQPELTGDRVPKCPAWCPDFATYKKQYLSPYFMRTDEVYKNSSRHHAGGTLAAGVVTPAGFIYHLMVSRGPVQTGGSQHSMVLVIGDLDSRDNISSSVVVCDGDIRVKGNVSSSLVIARGSITIEGTAEVSHLIAGKSVKIANPLEPRMSDNPLVQRDIEVTKVIVEENKAKPLGFVTFFELSTVGVEVKVAEGVVRVGAVADGKAFAQAGVRKDDVITDVGGKKPDSAESLRRLLRDALAIGDATVTLKRGDKTETVKVSLPE